MTLATNIRRLHHLYQTLPNSLNLVYGYAWDWSIHDKIKKASTIYLSQLSNLERIPVSTGSVSDIKEFQEAVKFRNSLETFPSLIIDKTRNQLDRQILAHRYRFGELKQGEIDLKEKDALSFLAKEWKEKNATYSNKELTDEEIEKIVEVCTYREFMSLLMCDGNLREQFFYWILPNDAAHLPFHANDVEIFIKFPGLYNTILRRLCFLISRLGNLFVINQNNQTLTVPIEGERVEILNGKKEYTLRGRFRKGELTLTIDEIFKEMEKQLVKGNSNVDIFNLEEGFFNYCPVERGAYHETKKKYMRPELDDHKFFEKMPDSGIFTREELEGRYGVSLKSKGGKYRFCPEGTCPLFVLSATRKRFEEDKNWEIRGTHSWYILYIPTEDGKYREFHPGQLVPNYPQTVVETMLFLPKTHPSRIFYGDWNRHAGNREHAFCLLSPDPIPSPEKWSRFMDLLLLQTRYGDEGYLGFNLPIRHCTVQAAKTVRNAFGPESIPRPNISFWNTLNPSGFEGRIFRAFKRFPDPIRNLLFDLLYFICGSWRGMWIKTKSGKTVWFSMAGHPTIWRKEKGVVHPGMFFPNNDLKAAL